MKALTDKKWRNTANAWGQFTDSAEQVFEIEPSDVGVTRKDYRGQAHSSYTFTRSDTGKRITDIRVGAEYTLNLPNHNTAAPPLPT